MKKFIIGLILGLSLSAISSLADGFMFGWEVTKKGRVICHDPYFWRDLKEIECD